MTNVTVAGGVFDHAHFGDSIYNIYLSGQTADESFDFEAFAQHVRSRLQREAADYVPLDVEPMVASLGTADQAEQQPLIEAVAGAQHVILVGAPGAGKTASLRYLAALGANDEIRAYIELSRYRKIPGISPLDTLLILVGELMTDWASAAKPPSIPTLRRLLQERPATLFLDGLNEVDTSIREDCLLAIRDLAFAFERCRIVFSTRPHGFAPLEGWSAFSLRELTNKQVAQFLHVRNSDDLFDDRELWTNPLLKLPLFLDYALRLAQRSGGVVRLAGSQTALVADYVALLFRDTRESASGEEALRYVLARLAMRLQQVGQSIPIGEAAELLADNRDLLAVLSAHGFIRVDARYVRFFHHTIQEYFFAVGQHDRISRSPRVLQRVTMNRVLAQQADEDALTFLPVLVREDVLDRLMRGALRANVSLATRWADDLAVDGRSPHIVEFYLRVVKRRIAGAASYSRVTFARRGGLMCVLLLFDLFLMLAVFDTLGNLPRLTLPTSVVFALPFVAFLAIVHYLGTFRGGPDMARIAAASRNLQALAVREGIRNAFEAITRSVFTGYELRQIALTVLRADEAVPDPLRELEASATPYLTIQLLGFDDSSEAIAVLEAVMIAGGGNLYSRAALQSLLQGAIRNRSAAERLQTLATGIWQRRGNWPFRRTAGRCLATLDARFRTRHRVAVAGHATLLAVGLALYLVAFMGVMLGLAMLVTRVKEGGDDPTAWFGAILLLLIPIGPVVMFAIAALLRSRRVYGYHGLDAWPPWAYFVWGLVLGVIFSPVIISGIFVIHFLGIYRNGRGLDMARVRRLVESGE